TIRAHWPRGCGRAGCSGYTAVLAPVLLRSPSPCPHAQNRFWIGEGNPVDVGAAFKLVQQLLSVEARLPRLPLDPLHRADLAMVGCSVGRCSKMPFLSLR